MKIISFIRAGKLVVNGFLAFLVHLRDESAKSPSIKSVLVVLEFQKAFPVKLYGMPLDRDIDFYIKLEPRTHTISILSYHMALAELRELKIKL